MGKTKRGKGTKIMGIADGHGLPLALRTESASPAEVKLVIATLEARVVAEVPERLIGDKAYDSDRLDEQLRQEYGTEIIAPNKVNRRVPTQDGRPCAVMCDVTKSNGSSPGSSTSADWWCATNIMRRIFKA